MVDRIRIEINLEKIIQLTFQRRIKPA